MNASATAAPTTRPSSPAGRPSRRTSWLIVASVVTLTGWYGSQRFACGPAGGTAFSGEKTITVPAGSPHSGRFRLATYNIHGGKGLDTYTDLGRIAGSLRGADLVGLNEVHGPSFWQPTNQADTLGKLTKLPWLFAPTEQRWWHEHFGNGVLCSLPVTNWQRIPLARRYSNTYRNLILVCTEVDGRPLNVVVTHLDRNPQERPEQLRTVVDFFLALAPPSALLGDLNTSPNDPQMQRLLAAQESKIRWPGSPRPARILIGSCCMG